MPIFDTLSSFVGSTTARKPAALGYGADSAHPHTSMTAAQMEHGTRRHSKITGPEREKYGYRKKYRKSDTYWKKHDKKTRYTPAYWKKHHGKGHKKGGHKKGGHKKGGGGKKHAPKSYKGHYKNKDLIWVGKSLKDFMHTSGAPGTITEVKDPLGSGKKVIKMTVSDHDFDKKHHMRNPAAQALSPMIIKPGDEFWMSTRFMLPADFPHMKDQDWMGLIQVFGDPYAGTAPVKLAIDYDEFRFQRNLTYKFDIPWHAPLIKGRWIPVMWHEKFGKDGFIEMWFDGKRVTFFDPPYPHHNENRMSATQRLNMATEDASNNKQPNSMMLMNFRKIESIPFNTATVYYDTIKVGRTQASVQ